MRYKSSVQIFELQAVGTHIKLFVVQGSNFTSRSSLSYAGTCMILLWFWKNYHSVLHSFYTEVGSTGNFSQWISRWYCWIHWGELNPTTTAKFAMRLPSKEDAFFPFKTSHNSEDSTECENKVYAPYSLCLDLSCFVTTVVLYLSSWSLQDYVENAKIFVPWALCWPLLLYNKANVNSILFHGY